MGISRNVIPEVDKAFLYIIIVPHMLMKNFPSRNLQWSCKNKEERGSGRSTNFSEKHICYGRIIVLVIWKHALVMFGTI